MAFLYKFFDDVAGDRMYTMGDWADYFANLMTTDGIAPGILNGMAPSNAGTLFFNFDTGVAFHNGYFAKNTASMALSLNTVTSGNKRIDRLVIRFDPVTTRSSYPLIIQGVETGGVPAVPAITAQDIYVGQILLDRSSGSYVYTVTDERQYLNFAVQNNIWMAKAAREEKCSPLSYFFEGRLRTPTAWNPASASTYWPAIALDAIATQQVFDTSHVPQAMVDIFRGQALTYMEGRAGQQSALGVTNWSITANVATLTFANLAPEKAALSAAALDQGVHGSYANWWPINIPSTIGNIPAGDYAITAVDTVGRTVTFAVTAANGSGSGAWTGTIYPYRIAGSTTSFRLYEVTGRALVSQGDSEGRYITGGRTPSRFQNHWHQLYRATPNSSIPSMGAGSTLPVDQSASSPYTYDLLKDPKSDGVTVPRTGPDTDVRSLAGHLYCGLGAYN